MGSTDVFVGKVLSVENGRRSQAEKITVSTGRWFLGEDTEQVTFFVAGGLCSQVPTTLGAEALIYAERDSAGQLVERGCMATSLSGEYGQRELSKVRHWSWVWRFQLWLKQLFTGQRSGRT